LTPLSPETYGSWQSFLARLVILYGDTVLSILLLVCSLLEPGILGFFLLSVTALVLIKGSDKKTLTVLVTCLTAWTLLSHMILIPSVYNPLFSSQAAVAWARWLGLPLFAAGYEIERGLDGAQKARLVVKTLSILVACSKIASEGWIHNIPPQVLRGAGDQAALGFDCPLFWPLAAEVYPKSLPSELSSTLLLWRWRAMSLIALTMTFLNSFWTIWGIDLCLASLLIACCLSSSALSLLLVPFIATSLASPCSPRRVMSWRNILLPLLCFLLVVHYGSFVGWNEIFFPLNPQSSKHPESPPSASELFITWLGLDDVEASAVVSLFLSLVACAVQVRVDKANDRTNNLEQAAGQEEGAASEQGGQATIFQALTPESRPQWSFIDWARYYGIKHSLDLLLVTVVVVCTVQRDVLHAGYLALALMFFRERRMLRAEQPPVHQDNDWTAWFPASPSALLSPTFMSEAGRGSARGLFWILPAFNFGVILLELLFQMPIEVLLPDSKGWNASCEAMKEAASSSSSPCSLPQLLGLCKITSSASFLASPALFDLLLFGLLRLYAKLSRSKERRLAMAVLEKADEEAARRLKVVRGLAKSASARNALKEARIEVSLLF
jgi:hypothetical protein